jgi:16S rRNA (adenine1518-N6/adenine1519-N6)-dimethyltransferase
VKRTVRFGQHFLEPAWVEKVIRAIDPRPDQTFVEIGPGHGALTRPLAARAGGVVAFEIDRDLVGELRRTMPPNVTIVEGDLLRFGIREVASRVSNHFRVAGNLPYNVASPMLFWLVELYRAGVRLTDATVMLQREVADRLLAKPGSRDYGVLSVLIGQGATIERLLNLPAGAFRPAPRVLSSVVRLQFHPDDPAVRSRQLFSELVQAVFTRRRKTMANAVRALANAPPLPGWLDATRRPETLSVAEFARLADDFSQASRAVL